MIQDVQIYPLKIISDDRGKVMHMLRSDSPAFKNFGEVYFSTIKKILESGIKLIQFRSKNLSLIEYTSISKKIFNICKLYNAFFIINDYKS